MHLGAGLSVHLGELGATRAVAQQPRFYTKYHDADTDYREIFGLYGMIIAMLGQRRARNVILAWKCVRAGAG